jgi:predicted transcriptional regulator
MTRNDKKLLAEAYAKVIVEQSKKIIHEAYDIKNVAKNAAQSIELLLKKGSLKNNSKDINEYINDMIKTFKLDTEKEILFKHYIFDNLKKLGIKILPDLPNQLNSKKYSYSPSNYKSDYKSPSDVTSHNRDSIHDTNIQSMFGL